MLIATFVINDHTFRETIRYSLQGIALMPLFSAVLLDHPTTFARKVLSAPIMVFIGRLSYSIYLFHLLARTPAEVVFGTPYGIKPAVSGLVATGILAYTVYIFVESPIAKLRHHLRRNESHGSSLDNLGSTPTGATSLTPSPKNQRQPINVLVLCPGGLEHGGGIGRQMGYFLAALPQVHDAPAYRVVDTRGPWFLGGARWRIPLSGLYLAAAACQIAWAGIVSRPSLLHVNITGRGSTFRKLVLTGIARAVALPYVLHIHDYDYAEDVRTRGILMRRLVRGMFASSVQIIVLGTDAEKTLRATLGLPNAPIAVLPNAVPDPRTASQAPMPTSKEEQALIVFLGYLSARKGVPELLEALASPTMAALPWRATLAGGGPIDEFQARAVALGLSDRVTFPGWIDQPAASELCAGADILVLPSHAEGLAMSVLEGLAHGLAVVTTPVGAHAEVIEPERSGLLTPPGDVAALSATLARVVGDPALRERLRAGARQRFLDRFEVRSYAARLTRLHVRLLADRSLLGTIEAEPQS